MQNGIDIKKLFARLPCSVLCLKLFLLSPVSVHGPEFKRSECIKP